MALSIAELRAALESSLTTIDVEVKDLGTVRLKRLDAPTGIKLSQTAAKMSEGNGSAMSDFMFELISVSAVDDSGALLFDGEGRELLSRLSFSQLLALGNAAMELNGIADANEKKS